MPRKYEHPTFLPSQVTQEMYERWLRRKAQAHVKRDRQRGNKTAGGEAYRDEIHRAVLESGGLDAYTGEKLDWERISSYDNDLSRQNKLLYKHGFALLPTVDHVGDGTGPAHFQICGWRTNDAKNDLALPDFLRLCQAVLEHHGYDVLVTLRNLRPGRSGDTTVAQEKSGHGAPFNTPLARPPEPTATPPLPPGLPCPPPDRAQAVSH